MRRWLAESWKDEAAAFVLLALALVFFTRQWQFFAASQAERAPRLAAFQPRPRVAPEPEREESSGGSMSALSPIVFGSGAMIYGMAFDTASSVIYYREQGDEARFGLGARVRVIRR